MMIDNVVGEVNQWTVSCFWVSSKIFHFLEHSCPRFCHHTSDSFTKSSVISNYFPSWGKWKDNIDRYSNISFTLLKELWLVLAKAHNPAIAFFWPIVGVVALIHNNLRLFPLPLSMKTLVFVSVFSKITGTSVSPDHIMKVASCEFSSCSITFY